MNNEQLIKLENPPRTVDLAKFGFDEARRNNGNATSFITHVDSIYVGSLLDKSIYVGKTQQQVEQIKNCLLYTSPSPRDATLSRMPSSA